MKLWSLHDPAFSPTRGRISHSLSPHYPNDMTIKHAYHKLWSKIGELDGQIVWCYTVNQHIPRTGIRKLLWCLDVPDDDVLCVVDDIAWNKIIGKGQISLPRRFRQEWNRQPKTGDWWDELIVADNTPAFLRTALIRYPLPQNFVVEKLDWQSNPS